MKILIINGPNLNKLKLRDKSLYSQLDLDEINILIKKEFKDDQFDFFQSNLEGEIINAIQSADEKYDGLIINPGGYSHTSVAIRDALEICKITKIEVHLSHLAKREDFRQVLITAQGVDGYISGFNELGYLSAVFILKMKLK